MTTIRLFVLLGMLLSASAAMAQAPATPSAPPPREDARFTMQPVEGGLMRLDTRTGAMAFCSTRAGAWACELVPEERRAYEDEIVRLNERIAALEKSGARPLPPLSVPDIMAPPKAGPDDTKPEASKPDTEKPDAGQSTGPEEAEGHIDRAMDMAERVFRRFLQMIGRLKDDTERL